MTEKYRAFTAIDKISEAFVSDDVKLVAGKGIEAAKEHKFVVIDAPSGSGGTVALNVLKVTARDRKDTIVVDLGGFPLTSHQGLRGRLWTEVLVTLGVKPSYRWSNWKNKAGELVIGRRMQLRDTLVKLYQESKQLLLVMDNALNQPRYLWELLYEMADLNVDGKRYGPGVVICADLADRKRAHYKPERIVNEGKPEFPDVARRLSVKLGGLNPKHNEVEVYVRFQAKRDDKAFAPDFIAEFGKALSSSYLEATGMHRLPGTLNAVGRNLMEKRHRLGLPIYQGTGAARKTVVRETAKVES